MWDDLPGRMVANRYRLGTLVSGSRDQAEYVADGPDGAVTVTILAASDEDAGPILAEMEKARALRHPHLLELLEDGRQDQFVYLVSEKLEHTLADRLGKGPLGEGEARQLVLDVLAGLEFLHSRGLSCGPLDPTVIVRAGGRWKLADMSRVEPLRDPGTDLRSLAQVLRQAAGPKPPAPFGALIAACLAAEDRKRWTIARIRAALEPVAVPAPRLADRTKPVRGIGYRPLLAGIGVIAAGLAVWAWRQASSQPAPPQPPPKAEASQPAAAPLVIPPVDKPSPLHRPATGSADRAKLRQPAPAPAPAPEKAAATAVAAVESDSGSGETTGTADFFMSGEEGHVTASGMHVSNQDLVAAHARYPFGTRLRVTNLKNGKSVEVRVVERRSEGGGRILSVSFEAARRLGLVQSGWARVRVAVLP